MKKYFIILLSLIVVLQCFVSASISAETPIKVGIYQNKPKVFMDSDGKARGLFIDVLEYIASKEKWRIQYVPGSWEQCMERLEKAEIDIMVDVAYSTERAERYDFSTETVLVNWAQLYTHKDSEIQTILALHDKKVAALRGDISYREFKSIVRNFGIDPRFIEADDFRTVFELVQEKRADAGLISRLFGLQYEKEYDVVKSPIICCPRELRFAAPKHKNTRLINIIDEYMVALKKDKQSIYHQSISRWLESRSAWVFPGRLKWGLVAGGALLLWFVAFSMILRFQVKAKTTALRESESRYRTLFNSASDAIFIYDISSGRYIEINQVACDRLDYSRGELLAKTPMDISSPQYAALVPERIEELRERGHKFFETEHVRRDGAIIPTEVSNRIIEYSGKQAVLTIARDITERKQYEETLRIIQFSIDHAAEHITWVGPDGRFLYANDEACRSLGYSRDEMLSMTVRDVVPDFSEEMWRDHWKDINQKGSRTFEARHRRKDGSFVPIETSVKHLSYGGKEFHIYFVRDISERKRAQERLKMQLDRLAALRSIDMAITASLDLRVTFSVFLDQVITQLSVDAADVLLLDGHTQKLEYSAGRGFQTVALQHTRLPLGEGYAGRAALERCTVSIPNLMENENSLKRSPLLAEEGFVSYYCVPLIAKGQVRGVLEIFHRAPLEPDQEWLDFLESLGRQAAIAIDNATLFSDLERSNTDLVNAYDATLEGWSRALDMRDKETEGHCERVTEMTLRLARSLGMRNDELVYARRGALLHDIGKMGIPDGILLKPGSLSDQEWEIMRKHPVYAYELLSPISFLRSALDIPYCHHEKWDGTGYPRGLKGEQIPLAARIFAVVDVLDALRSERPYRPAWTKEKAFEYIQEQSGRHFDPKVVNALFETINSMEHMQI